MDRNRLIASIFENTHTIKRGMFTRMHQLGGDVTLTHAQLQLLFTIKHQQPVNSKQLASCLQLTPGAISQLLESLTSRQLIERQTDPADRRVQTLNLTKKAHTLLGDIEAQRRAAMEHVMRDLTTDELTVWLRVQEKLIREFQQTDKPAQKGGA